MIVLKNNIFQGISKTIILVFPQHFLYFQKQTGSVGPHLI